jgi:hypothetical protein
MPPLRRAALALAVALLVTPPGRAQDPPPKAAPTTQAVEVPYKLTGTMHVMVRLKLNGKGPFNFIIDTGAPALILSEPVAKKAGADLDAKKWAEFDVELEGGLKIPKARGLATDMFQLRGMNALGLAGVELHGVVGYNVLAKYKIEYDFTKDYLRFTDLKFAPPKMVGLGEGAKGGQGGLELVGDMMKFMAPLMGIKPNFAVAPRGYLGVEVEFKDGKVLVAAVHGGSPADAAGVKKGDQIATIKGRDIDDLGDLERALKNQAEGAALKIVLKRGEQTKDVTVTLGKGL